MVFVEINALKYIFVVIFASKIVLSIVKVVIKSVKLIVHILHVLKSVKKNADHAFSHVKMFVSIANVIINALSLATENHVIKDARKGLNVLIHV